MKFDCRFYKKDVRILDVLLLLPQRWLLLLYRSWGAPLTLKRSRCLHLVDLKWAPRPANFTQQHRCAVHTWAWRGIPKLFSTRAGAPCPACTQKHVTKKIKKKVKIA